ncbi:MAG: hypothetical protein JWM56_1105 [Candidatus Peribacteria bacterium]|nr:hypothetical protein [Candidatus Peribacteria bacterium]
MATASSSAAGKALNDTVLLRIRPSLPDPEEVSASHGPLSMETVLSSLHSLKGRNADINFEIGFAEGKIGLFARTTARAAPLVESQLYSQYSESEIERAPVGLFTAKEHEMVYSSDLVLSSPEIFPIRRHPQFIDLASRQPIDPIAGITSALVRYPKANMRGHIQMSIRPIGGKYRKRALKFLPLLSRGIAKHWPAYAKLFARIHLARGKVRWLLWPLDLLMGGFRSWFKPGKISLITGQETEPEASAADVQLSTRSHEKEDSVMGAVDKVNRLLFVVNIRVSVIAPAGAAAEAEAKVEEIASSFRQFTLPNSNDLTALPIRETPQIDYGFRVRPYVLSSEEVATIWHLPNILVKTPNMDWVLSRKVEPPFNLPLAEGEGADPTDELTVLGEALFRGERTKFGIRLDDRRRHMYVIGKTGMGKSTILQNMVYSDIQSGKGVAVIDPHGDLIESILTYIPASRTNDVILIDPADREYPIAFNMLSCPNPEQRGLVASGLMSIFKKLWPEAFSGRMEYILRNALLALLEAEGNSMLGIMRMFSDDQFRRKVLEHTSDHMVKTFWEVEYVSWSDKYRTEAIAAIQNKIGQLLSTPVIRNIVGQVNSTLDVRHAMDSGKIILANLSKGKIGEDNSAFLGSMLVTKFQLDAMSRADIPEKDRRDFFLYVDEFQNFATESFATILSEARKYRLNLTMAHQYIGQLLLANNSTALQDAVFGNVGSICSFQVGSDDAEPLSQQFEEIVQPKDILSLPKYQAYMRLMIKGIPSKPFSVATLPPPNVPEDAKRVETIRRLSRERYTQTRVVVEEKIAKWLSSAKEAAVASKSLDKMKEKEEEEKKKARAKKMSLEEYRKWRDREMWINEYNQLRKRKFLTANPDQASADTAVAPLGDDDMKRWTELEKKLTETGGIPPPSKLLTGEGKKPREEKKV